MKQSKRSFLLQFDRIMALDSKRQVLILAIVLAVIFVASFFLLSLTGGDWKTYCAERHISHWVFPLYLLIDANAFHDFCVFNCMVSGQKRHIRLSPTTVLPQEACQALRHRQSAILFRPDTDRPA